MTVDAVEDTVRAEINASLADFDFDPAPRVVAALERAGFITTPVKAGFTSTTEEREN
jgi:hypothetical protein